MKAFEAHSEDCTCQQCMNLLILRRIDALEERLLPGSKSNENEKKSAFQQWNEKHIPLVEIPGHETTRNIGRKEGWNAAIDVVQAVLYLHDGTEKLIEELKEP